MYLVAFGSGAQQLADPTITAPTTHPVHDGVSNELKHVFDINSATMIGATEFLYEAIQEP